MKLGVSIATLFPKRAKQNSRASVSVFGFEIFVSQGESINRLSNFEVVIPMPYGIGFKDRALSCLFFQSFEIRLSGLDHSGNVQASIINAYLEKCGHRK